MPDRQPDTAGAGRPESWRYTIEQPDGRLMRGEVVGCSEAEALLKLRALGGMPLELKRAPAATGLFSGRRTHLEASEVLDFTRGIAELVDAGIPLRDALASLAQHERRPALRAALVRVEDQVRHGEAFSKALEVDVGQFPRLLIALARAGEASGLLGKNLVELAAQMEDERSLRQDLIGQMIYPMALVVLISLTLVFLSYFVLPQFETIFLDAGVAPPPETAFVLAVGAFLRAYAVWIPPLIIALAIGMRLLARQFRSGLDRLIQLVPVLGPTLRTLEAARYCRTLGLLLASGQPLSRAEVVARSTIASPGLQARYAVAGDAVRAGESLSVALGRQRVLPAQALRFVELGERTGRLDVMLNRAAKLHDREVRNMLKSSVELIGPVMIGILGLCVGGVIAAVMSGVLSLNEVVY
ncbi:type II secretion system F family protein [Maricaulis sp.]|uniref:type II secretion system F family protein n=1 Tax=Maricaulis sp. TaxID=1486257 RepID=UPI003A8E8044